VDPLTGLYNHRHFYESLVLEANRFNRQQRSFTLLFLDVIPMDPERGAVSGEEAVRALAEMLQQTLRRGVDVAFKLRGAEFGVILGGTRDREAAQAALRIQETFASRRFPGVDLKVRINEFATTRTVSSILEFARRRLQQEEP
jgi:diguanylate cyclase (GGDEF)-like protein